MKMSGRGKPVKRSASRRFAAFTYLFLCAVLAGCGAGADSMKHDVIFDTDANNEVDDQHALAYTLFSGDAFNVVGVTVNATSGPGGSREPSHVREHYDEAKRVMRLCGELDGKIPLLTGADGSFDSIREHIDSDTFDGSEAVDFIIEEAMRERGSPLVVIAVGKLTNVALALKKAPEIADRLRVVWLGSNYPARGEHNLWWDIPAMNYVLDTEVPFDLVVVRWNEPSGTHAVRVTLSQIAHRMPGLGPRISEPVEGRHGGYFDNWGDYSAELFERYGGYREPPSRALFDVAAVAIVKNPAWADSREIPAPTYVRSNDEWEWVERPDNSRQITLWEWFDIYGIMYDFFRTMENPVLADPSK